VLLLVLQPQFHQLQPGIAGLQLLQQAEQGPIQPLPPCPYLGQGRPAEQAPLGPGVAGSY
jgi:hypothetical protein